MSVTGRKIHFNEIQLNRDDFRSNIINFGSKENSISYVTPLTEFTKTETDCDIKLSKLIEWRYNLNNIELFEFSFNHNLQQNHVLITLQKNIISAGTCYRGKYLIVILVTEISVHQYIFAGTNNKEHSTLSKFVEKLEWHFPKIIENCHVLFDVERICLGYSEKDVDSYCKITYLPIYSITTFEPTHHSFSLTSMNLIPLRSIFQKRSIISQVKILLNFKGITMACITDEGKLCITNDNSKLSVFLLSSVHNKIDKRSYKTTTCNILMSEWNCSVYIVLLIQIDNEYYMHTFKKDETLLLINTYCFNVGNLEIINSCLSLGFAYILVLIDGVTRLYAYEFEKTYNPTLVNVNIDIDFKIMESPLNLTDDDSIQEMFINRLANPNIFSLRSLILAIGFKKEEYVNRQKILEDLIALTSQEIRNRTTSDYDQDQFRELEFYIWNGVYNKCVSYELEIRRPISMSSSIEGSFLFTTSKTIFGVIALQLPLSSYLKNIGSLVDERLFELDDLFESFHERITPEAESDLWAELTPNSEEINDCVDKFVERMLDNRWVEFDEKTSFLRSLKQSLKNKINVVGDLTGLLCDCILAFNSDDFKTNQENETNISEFTKRIIRCKILYGLAWKKLVVFDVVIAGKLIDMFFKDDIDNLNDLVDILSVLNCIQNILQSEYNSQPLADGVLEEITLYLPFLKNSDRKIYRNRMPITFIDCILNDINLTKNYFSEQRLPIALECLTQFLIRAIIPNIEVFLKTAACLISSGNFECLLDWTNCGRAIRLDKEKINSEHFDVLYTLEGLSRCHLKQSPLDVLHCFNKVTGLENLDNIIDTTDDLDATKAVFFFKISQLIQCFKNNDILNVVLDETIRLLEENDYNSLCSQILAMKFTLCLSEKKFDECCEVLSKLIEFEDLLSNCLIQFTHDLCTLNSTNVLLQLTFCPEVYDELVRILELRARSLPIPLDIFNLYELLHCIHLKYKDGVRAATILHEYSRRLRFEKPLNSNWVELNALAMASTYSTAEKYLKKDKNFCLVEPVKYTESLDDSNKGLLKVVDISELQKEFACASKRLELWKINKNLAEQADSNLDLLDNLCDEGLFDSALQLSKICQVDSCVIFERMARKCLKLLDNKEVDYMWLKRNEVFVDLQKSYESSINLMKNMLSTYGYGPGIIHLKIILTTYLNSSVEAPAWLLDEIKREDAAMAIRLFYKHGKIIDAARLIIDLLETVRFEFNMNISSFKDSIPYNVIDCIVVQLDGLIGSDKIIYECLRDKIIKGVEDLEMVMNHINRR